MIKQHIINSDKKKYISTKLQLSADAFTKINIFVKFNKYGFCETARMFNLLENENN